MLQLKTFFRYLFKNKLYTAVTIFGFAISLTFILLITVYIQNELKVDDFHVNKERIFRIEDGEYADFSPPIAEEIKNSTPEIEDFTRVLDDSGIITTVSDQKFKVDFLGVDASFFKIFTFPLVEGDSTEVLISTNSIVISRSLATKLFGTDTALGQEVVIDKKHKFMVTGIMDDFPLNTHFKKADALINFKAFNDVYDFGDILHSYGFGAISIYYLAKPNTDLASKGPEVYRTYKKHFEEQGYSKNIMFTPLEDLYFSQKPGHGTKNNSKSFITVLSVIVLLILVLAISNYVNLTLAQSTFRGREVAIKKLLGGTKRGLFSQFIKESILICFIAVVLSLLLAKLAESGFDSLLDTELNLNENITFLNLPLLIGGFCLIGIFSGLLPALKIASFKPLEVVKGTLRTKSKGVYSKVFITFQYTVTIALLACSWLVLKQTNFLRSHDLGFRKDNIIHMDYLGSNGQKETIKNALQKLPGVQDVSITWGSPLDGGSNMSFDFKGKEISFQEFAVDSSFFKVFDLQIEPTANAFSKDGVYINETALKTLEFESGPNAFKPYDTSYPILGVVNDFNFNELSQNIGPIVLFQQQKDSYTSNIFLKISGADSFGTISKVKSAYAALVDNVPFEVVFVDDAINAWYIKEEKTAKIIGYFTLLSFIISFMGILAMSIFFMQQRRKEISIRKVNGATISQILSLLNKDFLKWVMLAFLIAVPISWYAINQWLQNFAYKTTISWWIFALAGITALTIAALTVSWQSLRVARENPINSLRDE